MTNADPRYTQYDRAIWTIAKTLAKHFLKKNPVKPASLRADALEIATDYFVDDVQFAIAKKEEEYEYWGYDHVYDALHQLKGIRAIGDDVIKENEHEQAVS